MKNLLAVFLTVVVISQFNSVVLASEKSLLEAIAKGQVTLDSQIAIPDAAGDEALELPGAANASGNMLYNITQAQVAAINNKAYPLMSAKWPFNVVFVCWESLSPADLHGRDLVRRAVSESWEAHSSLQFLGWSQCTDNFVGVRIQIADTGPHVKFLGKYLSVDAAGRPRVVKGGMVLNFTFDNWSPSCKSMVDFCIYSIAVHEFGHAIGFAHEQNRPDTPGECAQPAQGTPGDVLLTPWDAHSVMNYCNPEYNNNGALSEFDIMAVRYIYGSR